MTTHELSSWWRHCLAWFRPKLWNTTGIGGNPHICLLHCIRSACLIATSPLLDWSHWEYRFVVQNWSCTILWLPYHLLQFRPQLWNVTGVAGTFDIGEFHLLNYLSKFFLLILYFKSFWSWARLVISLPKASHKSPKMVQASLWNANKCCWEFATCPPYFMWFSPSPLVAQTQCHPCGSDTNFGMQWVPSVLVWLVIIVFICHYVSCHCSHIHLSIDFHLVPQLNHGGYTQSYKTMHPSRREAEDSLEPDLWW